MNTMFEQSKKKYNLNIRMNKKFLILATFWQGSSDHIGSLWRVELDFLCVDQILNLVLKVQQSFVACPGLSK